VVAAAARRTLNRTRGTLTFDEARPRRPVTAK
jgi:hypothetical protein